MAMLGELKGIPNYPCPMCGSPVYSSALQCASCGTDLTRAGVVFSSSGGTSVEVKTRRRPGIWVAVIPVVALGVAAGTVGRPWVEPFAAPGLAVAKAAAGSTLRTVRHYVFQIPEKMGRATAPRTVESVRPAAKPVPKRQPAPAAAVKKAPPATPAAFVPTPAATVATLTISSTPRGARVQIDGVARGVTPVTVSQLRAGLHEIRFSHKGYRPVTKTVSLEPGKKMTLGVSLPAQTPPKAAAAPKPAAPVPGAEPLGLGRMAPAFAAKDRVGVIYRTTDFRGQKLILVFVQSLDGNAQRIIRELNTLHAGGSRQAVVVVMRPDRASIRQFVQAGQIQIPLLFGTEAVARAYGVGAQAAVLYLVSEDGRVVLRQVGRVSPRSVPN